MAPMPRPVLEQTAARFALLGDPTRRHLRSLVRDRPDGTVGGLAAAAGVSVANAAQHLRRLEAGGVLGRRRVGNTVQYRVVDASIEQLCAMVCASVRARSLLLV